MSITLSGADADNDSLTYVITAPPTNGTLVGTPPSVTFRPNTNYFGTDSFQFVVNDGYTNSAPARVSIKVTAVQDVSASTMALSAGTNLLHMDITGEPHQRYVLELSTNLVQWLSLTNLQCNRISGRATWNDTNLTEDRCFYRLKELP